MDHFITAAHWVSFKPANGGLSSLERSLYLPFFNGLAAAPSKISDKKMYYNFIYFFWFLKVFFKFYFIF